MSSIRLKEFYIVLVARIIHCELISVIPYSIHLFGVVELLKYRLVEYGITEMYSSIARRA